MTSLSSTVSRSVESKRGALVQLAGVSNVDEKKRGAEFLQVRDLQPSVSLSSLSLNQEPCYAKEYEIGTQIGKGAYGVVYACIRRSDNKEFVIKEIDFSQVAPLKRSYNLATAAAEVWFARRVVANGDPTLTVAIQDAFQCGEQLYIVSERWDMDVGELASRQARLLGIDCIYARAKRWLPLTLADIRAQRSFNHKFIQFSVLTLTQLRQLYKLVERLDAQHIVHCDLTRANVLVKRPLNSPVLPLKTANIVVAKQLVLSADSLQSVTPLDITVIDFGLAGDMASTRSFGERSQSLRGGPRDPRSDFQWALNITPSLWNNQMPFSENRPRIETKRGASGTTPTPIGRFETESAETGGTTPTPIGRFRQSPELSFTRDDIEEEKREEEQEEEEEEVKGTGTTPTPPIESKQVNRGLVKPEPLPTYSSLWRYENELNWHQLNYSFMPRRADRLAYRATLIYHHEWDAPRVFGGSTLELLPNIAHIMGPELYRSMNDDLEFVSKIMSSQGVSTLSFGARNVF